MDVAKASGIGLFILDGKLRVEAPRGVLTPELRAELSIHKAEIVRLLVARSTRPASAISPNEEAHREPVPQDSSGAHLHPPPYIEDGTLTISFNADPRYFWWNKGQSVAATLAELCAGQGVVGDYGWHWP
jgi:hypothetical protein